MKDAIKIYFVHSVKSDYNNNIYLPVLRSNILSKHILTFPQNEENKGRYFKDLIQRNDLIVIDLSDPDVGLNMEIKEAILSKKPILCLANLEKGYDPRYQKLVSNIVGYRNEEEFRINVEKFVQSYEGRIIGGKIDPTQVLGILN